MKNGLLMVGILSIVLVFGMTVVGCDNNLTDDKEMDPRLIGKWEFEKMTTRLPMESNAIKVKPITNRFSLRLKNVI